MRDELTRLGVPATGVSVYSSSLNSTLPPISIQKQGYLTAIWRNSCYRERRPCGTYGPRETGNGHFFTLLDYNSADDTAFIGDPAGYMGSACGFYSLDTILSPAQAIFWPTG